MPSQAYTGFHNNLKQVDRLLKNYRDLRPNTRGRKHLDHLTRAALLFLCATWEVYLEQIALEACKIVTDRLSSPTDLPPTVKKKLSHAVKGAKHDLEPITFAMDWKAYYCALVGKHVAYLNTPKSAQVLEILGMFLGADGNMVKTKVPSLQHINDIVQMRGEIAHNIYSDTYVREEVVSTHRGHVVELVKEVDIFLWDYLPTFTPGGRPWQYTYHR